MQCVPSQLIFLEQLGFIRKAPMQKPVEVTFDEFMLQVPIQTRVLFFGRVPAHQLGVQDLECMPFKILEMRWKTLDGVFLVVDDFYTEFIPK